MIIRMIVALTLMAVAGAVAAYDAGAQGSWGSSCNGASHWYSTGTEFGTLVYIDPTPAASWVMDRAGCVRAVHVAPHDAGQYSAESIAVGSLWLNGAPALPGVFAVDGPLAPMTLTTLASIPAGALRVVRGDVITLALDSGETGAPTFPAGVWMLEVRQ